MTAVLQRVSVTLPLDDLERIDEIALAWAARELPDRFAIGSGGGLAARGARERRYVLSRRAEAAVALYTRLPWNAGDPELPDVGDDLEVRYRHERGRDLPFNTRRDHAERRYVLAWPGRDDRSFELVGWCRGAFAVLEGSPVPAWKEPGASCVRWRALRPISELRT